MQNRAVRLCRNLKKSDHITEHYRALRWLPLEYLIQYKCLCLMNRQYHGHRCVTLSPPLRFGRFHQYMAPECVHHLHVLRDTDYPVLRNISAISPLIGGILYLHTLRLRELFHLMCIII